MVIQQKFRKSIWFYSLIIEILAIQLFLVSCGNDKQESPIAVTTLSKTDPNLTAPATTGQSPTPTPSASPIAGNLTKGIITSQTTPQTPSDWPIQWLKGLPCRPPCYENITPGKTTAEEAKKLLQQNPLVEKVTTYPSFQGSPEATIEWDWKKDLFDANSLLNSNGGTIVFDDKITNSPIKRIMIKITPLALQEIIQAYGEPSHIIASFDRNYHGNGYLYFIDFFYLSKGLRVSTGTSNSIPTLSKDIQVPYILFSIPGEEGIISSEGRYGKELLIPWQGFKDWRFYCRYYSQYSIRTEVSNCSQVPEIGSP